MKTRKEMKEEYKQMNFQMGVFSIKNNVNQKIYVGSSLDLVAIWHAQKLQLNIGMHQNAELQSDWKKYGAENFSYQIVEEIIKSDNPNIDYSKEVKILEELIIDELQPFDDNGYNRRKKLK